jgi:hypothetical protein
MNDRRRDFGSVHAGVAFSHKVPEAMVKSRREGFSGSNQELCKNDILLMWIYASASRQHSNDIVSER